MRWPARSEHWDGARTRSRGRRGCGGRLGCTWRKRPRLRVEAASRRQLAEGRTGTVLEPAAEDGRATARRIVGCYVRAFILPN
jgi:hypothetical protein